jgi:GNAT superfamily N-acetyltransferase
MSGPSIVVIGEGDDALCQEAYDRVFRPAFDTTELPDISGVRPAEGRIVIAARDESGVVAAGASDTVSRSDIGLLSYLAARPDGRSRGWGAKVLDALRDRWTQQEVDLVLGEVRDPRFWPPTDTERAADRLRFYARNGCHLLSVPWVQPAIESGPREPGLLLLAVHGSHLGARIEAARLAGWAASYYEDAEGEKPSDPQFEALIARLAANDVELIPIEQYERVQAL